MLNRIKILTILFGVLGLSGCIVVDDEVPVYYSSYSTGSYDAAIDYYHRPLRPSYMSHHKYNASIHKKGHHLNPPKHIKRPEAPKKEKQHQIKKPEHRIKDKTPEMSHPHTPKQDKITKIEPKQPIRERLHKGKLPEHAQLKNERLKNVKPKIHFHK